MTLAYVDTSALAKRYFPERRAEEFDAFLAARGALAISRLTVLELRCLAARRKRAGELDPADEAQILLEFDEDIQLGTLVIQPLSDVHALRAVSVLAQVAPIPLRTLDALHLGIAKESGMTTLVTADRVMIDAGKRLGFEVIRFD